ncbi:Phosphoglycerate mutase [Pleurostoma richardsiae]|uniref:Phosphoglycerate mutase n=1 Tax=Pleurostoma richardsiae TaxID=41990 RepID=A0AA38RNE5_9PEZI|nr:Phosphoglycerate mutase [Pleurostoma richardsiae]
MTLEVIYVTRHGFRSNWLVDPSSGGYTASIKSPTGIPADPTLTAHGVGQAKELAAHLLTVDPPVERVYSSPYYRCLQTVEPFVGLKNQEREATKPQQATPPQTPFLIRAETGLSEWYGSAPFEHPTSAPPEVLKTFFPALDKTYPPLVKPNRMGETIDQLHDRVATTMDGLIRQCDAEGVRAVLLCSHAATIIALGRVLTGSMPDSVDAEDFRAFTCGLTVYRRNKTTRSTPRLVKAPQRKHDAEPFPRPNQGKATSQREPVAPEPGPGDQIDGRQSQVVLLRQAPLSSDESASHADPGRFSGDPLSPQPVTWRGGKGVGDGWTCEVNSDCSFLSGGEERGWRFSGDESFGIASGQSGLLQVDAGVELGVVVEGSRAEQNRHKTGDSRL